jgi:four helix bundle protein
LKLAKNKTLKFNSNSNFIEIQRFISQKNVMKNPIRSFKDLEVYQNSYSASIEVISKIVPNLPKHEQNDLADQMRRSAKAIPRLIAEGYSKKHQKKGFQKYLDDAMAESNEMIVSLSHTRDLYSNDVDPKLCDNLIDIYDKTSRQLYNLSISWKNFKER